jgi:hypothetical protein
VIPLVLAAVAGSCLLLASLLLRRLGAGYRVARLLASAPQATLAEVAALAAAGERRYVRATGRVSSDEEFPDEHDRPLVFRRRRLERRDARSRWTLLDEERIAVPFGIEDRTTFVAVDADALGEGLVTLPRESEGTAAELPPDVRATVARDLDPATPVRLRIHQVSAVEHATVAGMPAVGPGGPMLTAGLGRPLIVSMLEPAAAMRVLAGDRRRAAAGAAMLILAGLGLLALAIVGALAGW